MRILLLSAVAAVALSTASHAATCGKSAAGFEGYIAEVKGEAQAAGVPVVAEAIAGVPEAVADRRSGVLVAGGDTRAYGCAIADLLQDAARRARLSQGARAFVQEERLPPMAAGTLDEILRACTGDMP